MKESREEEIRQILLRLTGNPDHGWKNCSVYSSGYGLFDTYTLTSKGITIEVWEYHRGPDKGFQTLATAIVPTGADGDFYDEFVVADHGAYHDLDLENSVRGALNYLKSELQPIKISVEAAWNVLGWDK